MTDYPLNTDESHEYLQQRQGWSVAAMREQIDSQQAEIESQKEQILWLKIEVEGLSMSSTRQKIKRLIAANEDLKKELYESRDFWAKSNHDLLEQLQIEQRRANSYQAPVRNALTLLRDVNCGNVDDAKISMARLVLEDADKKRCEK